MPSPNDPDSLPDLDPVAPWSRIPDDQILVELTARLAALTDHVQDITEVVRAMQERERWYARRRHQTPAQELAVIRQVTIPRLLEQIREGGA